MATGKLRFIQACELLCLAYEEDPRLKLSDGTILKAQIHVPNFSSKNGIWVDDISGGSYDLWCKYNDELRMLGASASFMSLNDEDETSFDLEGFKDMFCEWGWTGTPEMKPDWAVQYVYR